jgi:hypothetical protein
MLVIGTPDDLKQWPGVTPEGTQWLEIVSHDGGTILKRLYHRPGVHQATIFGQSVHALVDKDRTMSELGLDGYEVYVTEPTLEDVFVTISRSQSNEPAK